MADQVSWASPSGQTVNLTDESAGYRVVAVGTTGLRSVTYEIVETRYAGIDGARVDAIRAEPNTPSLGLSVRADGHAELRQKVRRLVHLMRPKAGPGLLTVRNESGETRSLTCYCVGGLEGDESPAGVMPGRWWRALLKFYAPDPWWRGEERQAVFGLGAPVNFFPIPPVVLAPSSVQGSFSVDLSDADAPAYPLWTVTGPGTALTLTNETTGREIAVTATLTAGQQMVIDTRPGHQSVRRADGTSLMSGLSSDPALWPLIEGVNEITAELSGATSASSVSVAYAPRYAGI